MSDCIFCQIVSGQSPSYKVWENQNFLAFLSIFPNTQGVTVVIPKQHFESYIFAVPDDVRSNLMAASQKVAAAIVKAFPDAARVGVVFEGFGVNHLHAKLFPLHGTADIEWHKRASRVDKYFEHYEGYISSHDYTHAEDVELAKTAALIRQAAGQG